MKGPHKFVGGSMHGKRVAVPNPHCGFNVPVYGGIPMKLEDEYSPYVSCRTEHYHMRSIALSAHVRVDLMVLSTLNDAEAMRRVADLIEA